MIAYALFVIAWHTGAYLVGELTGVGGWRMLGIAFIADVACFIALGVAFVLTIATKADQERESVARIRARLFEHTCTGCGELHGGYPWRQPR